MHPQSDKDGIQNSTPFPVDISRVKPSDTVQSHLSTSHSSKRIRISPSAEFEASGRTTSSDQTELLPVAYSLPVRKDLLSWIFSFHAFSTGRFPARSERSWTTWIMKSLLFLYCGLSCVVSTAKLYSNIIRPVLLADAYESLAIYRAKLNIKTMDQYLTRSLTAPAPKFEPFVLANKRFNSSVTICAWSTDTDFHLINKWAANWTDSISLLITTTATPSSASHGKLLKAIRGSLSKNVEESLSIHILHLRQNELESPNLYLNLAKLFSLTEWIAMIPDDLRRPISHKIDDSIISTKTLKRDAEMYVLSYGNVDSYPFPALSPLLLRRKHDFWCTERNFLRTSRVSGWNECIWQASLEMIGKIRVLNVPAKDSILKDESNVTEGVASQRLSARFRGETCDMFLRQVIMAHPRGRYKGMSLDWVKSFCTKTVDRKLSH